MVQDFAASALAQQVDSYPIQGTGSDEPLGILNDSGISETGTIGAIAWEDVAAAAAQARLANHEPNSMILGVQAYEDLQVLPAGDGTNSMKGWVPAPSSVADLSYYATNNCPQSQAVVGDFSKAIFGVREQARIEVSQDVGFQEDSSFFKVVWIGGFAVVDRSAFHRLA